MELGKAKTNEKCHFAISWARSCQYQCLRNSLSKYSTQFKRQGHFHFFRIWRSAKPRPLINVILQFLELDLVNINVSAKFYQNIPNGLRVKFHCFHNLNLGKTSTNPKCHLTISKFHHNIPLSSRYRAIFTFSEFEPRQRLGQSKMTFDNILVYILSVSMRMQIFIKIFQTVSELSTFFMNRPGTKSSQTGRGQNLHKLSDDKIKCLIIGHSIKFNFKFQLTFLGSCNFRLQVSISIRVLSHVGKSPFSTNIWQSTINESIVSLERNFSDHKAGPTFAITSSLKVLNWTSLTLQSAGHLNRK